LSSTENQTGERNTWESVKQSHSRESGVAARTEKKSVGVAQEHMRRKKRRNDHRGVGERDASGRYSRSLKKGGKSFAEGGCGTKAEGGHYISRKWVDELADY